MNFALFSIISLWEIIYSNLYSLKQHTKTKMEFQNNHFIMIFILNLYFQLLIHLTTLMKTTLMKKNQKY